MKRAILVLVMLTTALAASGGSAYAVESTTFVFHGSAATTGAGAWGGMAGTVYRVPFDVDAGPLTVTVYDLDISGVTFTKVNPCCGPTAGDAGLGAYAQVGIAADTRVIDWPENGAQMFMTSVMGWDPTTDGKGSWDNQGTRFTHDSARGADDGAGYRSYLQQGWYNPIDDLDPRVPWTNDFNRWNFQYNAEKHKGGIGDPDYDTFDLRMRVEQVGQAPKTYRVEWWVRLHKASSWDEGNRSANWGCPWNGALNNAASSTDDLENPGPPCIDEVPAETGRVNGAWYRIESPGSPGADYFDIANVDFSAVCPHVGIHNGGASANSGHTITWGNVVVTGVPAAATEVWVDDDWTGTSPGNEVEPGKYFGYDAFATIQDGINAAASGGTVHVAPGMYHERLTINKPVDLRGAQHGIDPTAAGARTDPGNESVITEADLPTPNPDVLIEIPSSVTAVTVDGFTLEGDRTNPTADTSVVRCWSDDVAISNNIIDGKYDVLYKGGDTLTVHRNRMVVNKVGVTVQPGPASNVTISDNVFALGSSPAGGESAIYMTSCTHCTATGNAGTGFVSGNGIYGSNLTQLTVSGNTFTGNRKGVNVWGNSTGITVSDNDLSDSWECGINVKGQDVDITGNEIHNCFETGISIAKHVIETERVEIHYNNITGNRNYGLEVVDADIETVNATCNWWGAVDGPSGSGSGSGDAVSANVYFQPWLTKPAPSDCDYEGPLVHNVAPATVAVNDPVILTASVDDSTTGNSVIASAEYKLDDGEWTAMDASDGFFLDEVVEEVKASISVFNEVGIHETCVRGTDAAANIGAEECSLLAVYDPEGGFVTGGGWIDSPPGAYLPDAYKPGPDTVVVTPDSVDVDWSTNDTRYNGYVDFVVGPGTPPLGVGSLEMGTTSRPDKAQLFNYDHIGTALANIQAISYATYRSSGSTNPSVQYPAINVEVDYVGSGSSYTTLVWEPVYAYGASNLNVDTWQTWDTMAPSQTSFVGGWWSTKDIPGVCAFNCFVDWDTIVQNNPNAKIVGGFGVNIGSGWNGVFTGAVDALTFSVADTTVTYDFEPFAPFDPTGKATFGFVSKYKKGAEIPEGQTEFVFQAAGLNFHIYSYDWLIVAGAKAKFKGIGAINDEGGFKFTLTAVDADINENDDFDVDRFRIKIWTEDEDSNETVVYDNGLGAEDDVNATTEIGGGAIVIHTKKK